MKKLLMLPLFLSIVIHSLGQSTGSLKIHSKDYKNNIQTSLLAVIGNFGLQYERAINEDWSISLLGNYNYIFYQQTDDTKFESMILATQLRYYLDKNTIKNNGLYISSTYRFVYGHEHNPPLDNSDKYNKYSSIGAGLGYQLFIKKNILLDLNSSVFYNLSAKEDLPFDNTGWIESQYYDYTFSAGLNLNIGYRF